MAQLIEQKTELNVERKFGLGGTLICFEAMQQNELDIYPEYTGTGLRAILNDTSSARSAEETFMYVQEQFLKHYQLQWLPSFGFNNTYALVARESLGLTKISDLQNKPDIAIAFSHEFMNRPDGLPGLKQHYSLVFGTVRGMEHGLVYKAIESGEVDLTDAYSTDGKLAEYQLAQLEDDKGFFPPYFAAPVVRKQFLQAHPEVEQVLRQLAGVLNETAMQELNYQLEVAHKPLAAVARKFLIERSLIAATKPKERVPVWQSAKLWKRIGEHLQLTAVAVVLAVLLGVPLGLLISRVPKLAKGVLATTGLLQTIPSLALLGFMIPLFGIGFWPALVALFLYALLPIVRNTYTGLAQVAPALVEAARGMGMSTNQVLCIRTATVINIGTATLAAFIGAGGLGEFIFTGITLNDNQLILQGAVPAALLALLADALLGWVEKRLQPLA